MTGPARLMAAMTTTTTSASGPVEVDRFVPPPRFDEDLYVMRKAEPVGVPPRLCLPKPFCNPVARLAHGRYLMNHVPRPAVRRLVVSPAKGCRLVAWTLDAGQEVCFHYGSVVAFSSGLALHTIANLQLGALLALDPFYSVASGPGTLVFETGGAPMTAGPDDPVAAFAPSRLVAWDRGTEFDVEASSGLPDYYFSGVYVRPVGPTTLLLDADARHPGRRPSVLRSLTRLFRLW